MRIHGRDTELRHLHDALSQHRLVTLVGPGGVGKSRLAEEIAAGSRGAVAFVELAAMSREAEVELAIADALGLPTLDALEPGAIDDDLLLVLDNCEHLTGVARAQVEILLDRTQGLRILATSREELELGSERTIVLAPLALPESRSLRAIGESPAVQLFLERAEQFGSAIALDDPNADAVAALCEQLDGLPLALEIAASRTRSMTPAEILEHLNDRFRVMVDRRKDRSRRHRALEATVAWSYDMLSADERRLFEHLSVLPAGFDRATAARVGAALGFSSLATLDLLERLVTRSLVSQSNILGASWYAMLETLAHFGRERLEEHGRSEAAREIATEVACALATETKHAAFSRWPAFLLARLFAQFALLREGIHWALEHDETPARAYALAIPLWGIAYQQHAGEIAAIGARIEARWGGTPHPLRAGALGALAVVHTLAGDHERAELLADAALEAANPDDPEECGDILATRARATLGLNLGSAEALDWAQRCIERSARRAPPYAAEMRIIEAQIRSQRGERRAALACAAEALQAADAIEAPHLRCWALFTQAWLLRTEARDVARAAADQALSLGRELGYSFGLGSALVGRAVIAVLDGEAATGANLLSEALRHWRRASDRSQVGFVLRWVAFACARSGETGTANRVLDFLERRQLAPAPWSDDEILLSSVREVTSPSFASSEREVVAAARAALERIQAGAPRAAMPSDPSAGTFRPADAGWELAFRGETVRLPARKGLRDIARLLAQRGDAVHCLELTDRTTADDDGGPALDARALREIRARLSELQVERERAEAGGDAHAAAVARDELEAVERTLTESIGLGGRSRRLGAESERARAAVTGRIRAAIRLVEAHHPALARHLDASVRTGTWCVYLPEFEVDWVLA